MAENVLVHVVAGVVIRQAGRYLLVQENRPGTPVHGLWNWPAGRVDVGVTIEETAIREAKEETGYDVTLLRKLGIHQQTATDSAKHAFEARIVGGVLDWPRDEILQAKWLTLEEISDIKDQLRVSDWIFESIKNVEQTSPPD